MDHAHMCMGLSRGMQGTVVDIKNINFPTFSLLLKGCGHIFRGMSHSDSGSLQRKIYPCSEIAAMVGPRNETKHWYMSSN